MSFAKRPSSKLSEPALIYGHNILFQSGTSEIWCPFFASSFLTTKEFLRTWNNRSRRAKYIQSKILRPFFFPFFFDQKVEFNLVSRYSVQLSWIMAPSFLMFVDYTSRYSLLCFRSSSYDGQRWWKGGADTTTSHFLKSCPRNSHPCPSRSTKNKTKHACQNKRDSSKTYPDSKTVGNN